MLGKTFYALLTGREPAYLMPDGVPPPLFHIISRCCALSKESRYQTLAELKQSLVSSYDVLLNRAGGMLEELLSAIKDRFATSEQYSTQEISDFIDHLALASKDEQIEIISELPKLFFSAIAQQPLLHKLADFLTVYEVYVDDAGYNWGHAETIANRMNRIFDSTAVPVRLRALALDLSVRAAVHMNRFAAMDTCKSMVRSIIDNDLALHVVPIILRSQSDFLSSVEPSTCSNEAIKNAIRTIANKG